MKYNDLQFASRKMFLGSVSLIAILSIFLTQSCQTNLPVPSQNGAGTLGMRVNGTVWSAGIIGTSVSAIRYKNKDVSIQARIGNPNSAINIVINKVSGKGYYNMGNLNSGSLLDSTRFMYNDDYLGSYRLSNPNLSLITITKFDTIYNVISGTFTVSLLNKKLDTLKITEGRFDLNFIH